MQKLNTLHKNYTLNPSCYQLKLPLELDGMIPENDPVRLLSQFVEEIDLTDLYSTYQRVRKNHLSPRRLLKIMLYAYMNGIYTTRDIERCCQRDINFMYLLEGTPAPDHATLARFRPLHFAPASQRLLAETAHFLYAIGELSGRAIFIDGTKIEACANKYTFVWKKTTTKNLEKLLNKLADFTAECEENYGFKLIYHDQVNIKHLKKLREKLYSLKEAEGIVFVHGSGKRKSPLQKSIETLEEYLAKLKEYTQKLHICGQRNSYAKTDHDATFMRMKEDAMRNGQLKAGYNLQHGVDSEYIVWLNIGPQPTDTTTLIPFLKEMENHLSFKYQKIVADAGYESEENYAYLEANGQQAFIKPANYERSKSKKYKNAISRAENMAYDEQSDSYTCHNGKKLTVSGSKRDKSASGYEREQTIYSCYECSGCPYKKECITGGSPKPLEERQKNLYVSKKFKAYRQACLERITGEEGKLLRMNRSIQVEGSFGEMKQNRGFKRYVSRGRENVRAESILMAIGQNINKLHRKIQQGKLGMHMYPLKGK